MTKLDTLYTLATENNIDVIDAHFSNTKKAACTRDFDCKLIILDKPRIESLSEETCLLAEEIGHYETGSLYLIESTYNTPLARSKRIKCEGEAKRWAFTKILSQQMIQRAIDYGCDSSYEIAEYCNVTVNFLEEAIEVYRARGIEFRYRDE